MLQWQSNNPNAWNLLGTIATQKGDYSTAVEKYSRAIQLYPKSSTFHSNLGRVYEKQQRWTDAVECYQKTIELQPNNSQAHFKLGCTFLAQNQPADAIDSFQRGLKIQPDCYQAQAGLGNALQQQGRSDEAIACFERALELQPNSYKIHTNLGALYREQGNLNEAIACYQRALQLQPDSHLIHIALGNLYQQTGNLNEAVSSYQRTLQLQPDLFPVHAKLGQLHQLQGNLDEAVASFRHALQLQPDSYQAHSNLGNALRHQGKLDEAIACYRQALQLQPDYQPAQIHLGNTLRQQGKLAEAVAWYQQVLQRHPDSHQAHDDLGSIYQAQGKLAEAVTCCQRALQIQPGYRPAQFNLGQVLRELGKLDKAIEVYRCIIQLQPDCLEALNEYILMRRKICSWDGLSEAEESLVAASQSDRSAVPFTILTISDDPAIQLAATKNFSANYIGQSFSPLWNGERYAHDRIRLAYLSADFCPHPVASVMAELFERHDRSQFEVMAISFGSEDTSPMRQRLVRGVDRFIDVRQMSYLEAAKLIRNLEIDIAIDLGGYTRGNRAQILAHRPAPIQVNYVGYPATMGANFMDYSLVDPFVAPAEHQPYFTEKLVHLPDCYLGHDSTQAIGDRRPSRAECGLPDDGFVFCSFNSSYKISPAMFDVWMRLLDEVDGSVLWLKQNEPAAENLRHEATNRGIDPDRLVFAPRLDELSDHLARYRLADLFLDCFPYNAHSTASDALWAGLPLLTCAGRSFASRVAGSLLHAVGLPELVTHSLEEYEALALKLATHPDVLDEINRKLAQNRQSSPLFDSDRFRHNIEAAYTKMWSLWQQGEQPRAFAVTPTSETFRNPKDPKEEVEPPPQSEVAIELQMCNRNLQEEEVASKEPIRSSSKLSERTLIPTSSLDIAPDDTFLEIGEGVKICVKNDINCLTTYVLLSQGDWFESEMAFVRQLILPGMEILDIGANHGVYTLTMAQLLQGQGQVTAYEPASSVISFLRKSVAANALTTVKIVNAGLSDREGKATLFLSTNSELNSLQKASVEQKQETIQLLTLDRELESQGWQDISFVKLDAEGEEANILAGGQRFFSEQSPLVMFDLIGNKINLPLVKLFQDLNYDIYRFVPGLGLLAPFDSDRSIDRFQLNLFACKPDRVQQLVERRLLVKNIVGKPELPKPSYWLESMAKLSHAKPFLIQYDKFQNSSNSESQVYLEGLNYFFISKAASFSPAEQLAALQYSFECLQTAVHAKPSFSRQCSLARVAAEFGQREISVQALQKLVEVKSSGSKIQINEPFIPVNQKYDNQPFNDNLKDWLWVSILETYESSYSFNSYDSAQETISLLRPIAQNPFHSPQAIRRLGLAFIRHREQQYANQIYQKDPHAIRVSLNSFYSPKNKTLYGSRQDRYNGFFSILTVYFWAIVELYNQKMRPKNIDFSDEFIAYKRQNDIQNQLDVYSCYFNGDANKDIEGIEEGITLTKHDHHGIYKNYDFVHYNLLVQRYFTLSDRVLEIQDFLIEKYQIDFSKTIAVCYRGTDKFVEVTLADPQLYLQMAEELLKEDPDRRILIQTDQEQVRDLFVDRFKNKCFFLEEMPATKGDIAIHANTSLALDRLEFGEMLLATTHLLSRCDLVVNHTGNMAAWICLFRGNAEGIFQFDREGKLISPDGEIHKNQKQSNRILIAPQKPKPQPKITLPVESGQQLIEIEGGVKVCVKDNLKSLTTYVLLEQGDWFEAEMAFIRRLITPGMHVLDIGANHGVYALTMAKLLQGQGRVIAYEPARSVFKRLQQSVEANSLTTIEAVNSGLSDREGEATLYLSTNSELNSLQQSSDSRERETIQLLTLDGELSRRGWQSIDFVKLDAEGEESKILAGGQEFFSNQSPLVMFELKHGRQINLPLIQQFQSLGYETYSFIPGRTLLAPFNADRPVDGYQLNLFACKGDRAEQLAERGLLVREVRERPTPPEPSYWLEEMAKLTYATPLLDVWRQFADNPSPTRQVYLEGLNYYFLANTESIGPNEQLASLQFSFECLQKAVSTKSSFARCCSLVRVAMELGHRQVAVQILQAIINSLTSDKSIGIDEPFLPVNQQFDHRPFGDRLTDWLLVSLFETYENSLVFSSYFSPKSTVSLLEQIVGKPFCSDRTELRLKLALAASSNFSVGKLGNSQPSKPTDRGSLLPQKNSRFRYVFCAGMQRSGSTWSYNVARLLLQHAFGEDKIEMGYVGEGEALDSAIDQFPKGDKILLLKFHQATAATLDLTSSGDARTIFTYREPLNAIASGIDFSKTPLPHIVTSIDRSLQDMMKWHALSHAVVIPFEDITQKPISAIREIANALDLSVNDEVIRQVAAQTSYEALKQQVDKISEQPIQKLIQTSTSAYDPQTLLHIGHFPQGQRDWKTQLTPEQQQYAVSALQNWLDRDGNLKSGFRSV